MTDEELIARARGVGTVLRARPGDLDRLAGALLVEMADRLDGRPVPDEAAGSQCPDPGPCLHGYDPDSHKWGNSCTYCGRGPDDPLHASTGEGFTPV